MSLNYLVSRKRTKTLNPTQSRVLYLNLVVCFGFSIVEFLGNKLISDVLPAEIYFFSYAGTVGCTLAGDIWLSLMYSRITLANHPNHTTIRISSATVSFLAYFCIVVDIIIGFSVQHSRYELRVLLGTFLSSVLVFGQIFVSIYLIRETMYMVKLLKNQNTLSPQVLTLERKLRFCIKISTASSILNTIVLVYYAVFGMPSTSVQRWLLVWFLQTISKIGSSFGQIYSCCPIKITIMPKTHSSNTKPGK